MIGVKMREEDLGQSEAHPVAHHLALRALAALEQERLALAHERHRGDVAPHGGASGGGAEKRYGQHGENIDGAVRGARYAVRGARLRTECAVRSARLLAVRAYVPVTGGERNSPCSAPNVASNAFRRGFTVLSSRYPSSAAARPRVSASAADPKAIRRCRRHRPSAVSAWAS